MTKHSPFRYFKTSPEIIRLAVMLYVRFPLSLRNVEDLLHERGIEISHETVRFWWNRFGPMFAAEIRRNRVSRMRSYSNWQWHVDEVFVKINGERHFETSVFNYQAGLKKSSNDKYFCQPEIAWKCCQYSNWPAGQRCIFDCSSPKVLS